MVVARQVLAAAAVAGGLFLLGRSKMSPALRLGRHAAFLRTDGGKPFVLFIIGHNFPSVFAAVRTAVRMGLRGNPLAMMEEEALADPDSGLLHVERCVASSLALADVRLCT